MNQDLIGKQLLDLKNRVIEMKLKNGEDRLCT